MNSSSPSIHWLHKLISAAPSLGGPRKKARALHARTERRLGDVKKRCGPAFLDQMETIDLTALPAFTQSGRKKPSDRDLTIIGAVMDTHLGLGEFYVQSTDVLFLFKAPEVGAAPLRQAIMDELNVKLMPARDLKSELKQHQMVEQFGADVMKYVHTLDLKALLFADRPDLKAVPSVVRDIARMTLDDTLGDGGHFCATDKNTFAVLFSTPSPDFARQHMAELRDAVTRRAASLAATYTAHFENEHHPEHHTGPHDVADPKVRGKGAFGGSSAAKMHQTQNADGTPAEQKWYAALNTTIEDVAHTHDSYQDRLDYLPWDQGIAFTPILRRKTASVVGRFCRPAKPLNEALDSPAATATDRNMWAALPDVPLAKDLVNSLHDGLCCKKPEIICLPVHYHTVTNNVFREALLSHLAAAPKENRHFVSAELVGFDTTVAPFVINDYIRMLKPYVRTVLIQADIEGKLLDHFAGLPVHAAGLDLNFPGLTEKQRLKHIRQFAERSHYFFRRIYLRNATTKAQVQTALGEDYTYISGPELQYAPQISAKSNR